MHGERDQGQLLPPRESWPADLLAFHDPQLLAEQQDLQVFFLIVQVADDHDI
jgi:hypothetical protein